MIHSHKKIYAHKHWLYGLRNSIMIAVKMCLTRQKVAAFLKLTIWGGALCFLCLLLLGDNGNLSDGRESRKTTRPTVPRIPPRIQRAPGDNDEGVSEHDVQYTHGSDNVQNTHGPDDEHKPTIEHWQTDRPPIEHRESGRPPIEDRESDRLPIISTTVPGGSVPHQNPAVNSSRASGSKRSRPLGQCAFPPPDLGKVKVRLTEPRSFDEVAAAHPEVQLGGKWKPSACISRSKMALIIPYRDREKNLKIFLRHIHTFLQRQEIDYQIFVVEQAGNTTFNRGMMRNIGFAEAAKYGDFECTVFHDVDLMPEDERNLYHCPLVPRHLCVAINTREYKPLASKGFGGKNYSLGGAIFGGAVELRNDQFTKVNGYSNYYFGWGGEDDDLLNRITHNGLWVERPSAEFGRYKESLHLKDKRASKIMQMYNTWDLRVDTDGLNSLNYTVLERKSYKTHTWILVDIDEIMYREKIADFLKHGSYGQLENFLLKFMGGDSARENIRHYIDKIMKKH